jgi:putative oxidoreductase
MFDFDFNNGYVILRIICGLFFLPHAIAKITARQGPLGFFQAAGFPAANAFVSFAMVFEIAVGLALILGIYTVPAAWLACIYLVVATLAVVKVSKGKWLWNIGGCEFPLFWAICCVIVALHA